MLGPKFAIEIFKEVWVGALFFWKMAEILRKGIISACNDLYCDRFRTGGNAANFAPNSSLIGVEVQERI